MNNETRFRPVLGTEEKIQGLESFTPGAVYFAEDTGKMYLATDTYTKMVLGGAGISVFYGQIGEIQEDTSADNSYILKMSGLEDNDAKNLKENDLIINSDNCFYRVTDIDRDNEVFKADRLVVAGSGGGSGTGGGGQAAGVSAIYPYPNKQATNLIVRYGEECIIKFVAMAKDSAGDLTGGGYVKWLLDGKEIATQTGIKSQDYSEETGFEGLEIQTFDVSPYLKDSSAPQRLQGQFFLDNGTGEYQKVTKTWTISAINIGLKWDYDYSTLNKSNTFQLSWNISGNASIEKTSHILINGEEKITKKSTSMQTLQESINREAFELSHGVYDFGIYVSYVVDGVSFKTPEIHHEVMFVDEDNSTPLVAIGDFNPSVYQYDTLVIPVCIYKGSFASLKVDEIEIARWDNLDEISKQNWSFSSQTVGEKTLSIQVGATVKEFVVNVEDLNVGDIEEKGYAFKLKANEFASNQNLKDWDSNGVTVSFSDNFDWVNGGLQQEADLDGKMTQYICVKAGTTMTVNYKLFSNFTGGKSFKFIFKTVNCSDYLADAIDCLTTKIVKDKDGNDVEQNLGIHFAAQQAEYYSSANSITIPYCENSLLECEIDIDSTDEGKYIIPWLDGVPVGVKPYDTDTFTQERNSQKNIVIGSPDCDVYIYLIKVYEKHLTREAHLNNFIIDAPNAQEIRARYSRNNILSEQKLGEIDWAKVCENNPELDVHLYKIPYMTYTKKIKPDVDAYELYTNGDSSAPTLKAGTEYGKSCTINVQGTSSAAYGLAAFNLESKFKGFLNSENESVDGFALADGMYPEKSFYSKVNVASCENANNALNAYWYNKFQPYKCAAKNKAFTEAFPYDKHDTCYFRQGVIFIEDHNEVIDNDKDHTQQNIFAIDTDGYVNNPYYKFYSICNFGDSKKNYNSLHDPENTNEICVEVTDNQSKGQWMTQACGGYITTQLNEDGKEEEVFIETDLTGREITFDSEKGEGNEVYTQFKEAMNDQRFDVRYVNSSDGVDSATPKQVMGFFRLVNWFASNDPCKKDADHPHGYTDEPFTADTPNAVLNEETNEYEVTFPAYTFKKKDWQNKDTLLGGITVSTYAGTYTADCFKYRMAKMLSECEDYLIMDSVVYHYLFIERHTMVDNVAKNTFWLSEDEDNKYWCLVKDYDNDTADGNDNSGNLTLTYGYEAMDKVTGGTAYVFNAHQSVWFNFINNLEVAQRYMYQQLDTQGAWSATAYLKLFEDWQNLIPERIWIEDYFRKYIRPFKLFGNAGSKFLTMLEGGKKTAQRKQYETYQEIYLGTKYQASSICNSSNGIDIRGNSSKDGDEMTDETITDILIPVTMYNDCYIVQAWGKGTEASNAVNFKIRAKRGETYLVKPPIDNMNDATIYWFAPQTYSTIGDIGVLAPKNFSLNNTTKLKEFSIGETTGADKLSNLNSITLTGNVVLKKLIAKNCASLAGGKGQTLNLSDSISLQYLDTEGSAFTDITLPDNAPLSYAKLNDITGLIANNLSNLSTLTIQSAGSNYEKIGLLSLNNIDRSNINSLEDLVKKTPNLGKYYLKQVDWKVSAADITDNKINILESLLDKTPVSFDRLTGTINENTDINSHANSLSGVLTIASDYDNMAGALEIYNYYIAPERYPDLDINFENPKCKLSNLTVLDGNGVIKYKYKFTGSINLKNFFADKEISDYEALITKTPSAQYQYDFQGWNINNQLFEDDFRKNTQNYSEDIIVQAVFEKTGRIYNYRVCYDLDGSTAQFIHGKYGQTFGEDPYFNNDGKFTQYKNLLREAQSALNIGIYNSKDAEFNLSKYETGDKVIRVVGFTFNRNEAFSYINSEEQAREHIIKMTDMFGDKEENSSIYPLYILDDRTKVCNLPGNYEVEDPFYETRKVAYTFEPMTLDGIEGYRIVKNTIGGNVKSFGRDLGGSVGYNKVTFPTHHFDDGKPVLAIGKENSDLNFDGVNTRELNRIYWLTPNSDEIDYQLKRIEAQCFCGLRRSEVQNNTAPALNNSRRLIFDFPTSLEYIGNKAFYALQSLTNINDIKRCVELNEIGNSAFENSCGGNTELATDLEIPASVNKIGEKAFYNLRNTKTGKDLKLLNANLTENMLGDQSFIQLNDLIFDKAVSALGDGIAPYVSANSYETL